jgi:nitrite reductase (NADH) small subunit
MNANTLQFKLGPVTLIPPGEGRNFDVDGQRIAVFHTRAGTVFATQAECPHKNGPLADGLVGADSVICPLHAWKFDLQTSETTASACKLKTFSVTLDADGQMTLSVPVLEFSLAING